MTVSVIIVNWNGGKFLSDCLQHLERQTVRADRVFVVDNASSDGSAEDAEKFAGVTVLKMKTNLGFAAGNNIAIQLCDTDFIVLLNPDAFAEPDWLERLTYAAATQPEVAAFGCRQLRHGTVDTLDGIGDRYLMTGQVRREGYGESQKSDDLIARQIFSPCAAAALYRRQILQDCGGFDEDFFCYVEDVDLGFRIRLKGHVIMYVPDAVVYHVGSATTGRHSDFSIYHGHRNMIWVFVKNMPGILFWILLPLHLSLNVGVILLFVFRGRGGIILRAKWDSLLGLAGIWRKRKYVQKSRVASVGDIWRQLSKTLIP